MQRCVGGSKHFTRRVRPRRVVVVVVVVVVTGLAAAAAGEFRGKTDLDGCRCTGAQVI